MAFRHSFVRKLRAVLALAGTVFAAACATQTGLEVRDAVSDRLYGVWPLEEGGEFAVEFIHSVHQSPVRERFRREGGEIRPAGVRFFSFGAGMESAVEAGRTLTRDGDALVLSGSEASFRELTYIVGTVSDHLLLVNGKTVSLRNLCGKNAHIRIQIRRDR
jgi:hypothetical protein